MTAVAGRRPEIRLSAGFWVAVGLLAALIVPGLTVRRSSAPASALLLRTPCALEISTIDPHGDTRSFTLREPGLYRLPVSAASVLVRGAARLAVSEIPIGEKNESVLPTSLCSATGTSSTAGLLNGGR